MSIKKNGKEINHVCPFYKEHKHYVSCFLGGGYYSSDGWFCERVNKKVPDSGEGRCYDSKELSEFWKECDEFKKGNNPFGRM